jgi:hypothetical protein
MDRRSLVLALLSAGCALMAGLAKAAPKLPDVVAFRNPGCACCENWAKLMEKAGFKVKMSDDADLPARRKGLGIPASLAGCHIAQIEKYIIEGHAPVGDILRLLNERPSAMGLAVPGMPAGSPGMETGGEAEKYSVLLFQADGSSKVYSQH